jgi:hypothetical protein
MNWKLEIKIGSDRDVLWIDWDAAQIVSESRTDILIIYEGLCFGVLKGKVRERVLRSLDYDPNEQPTFTEEVTDGQ